MQNFICLAPFIGIATNIHFGKWKRLYARCNDFTAMAGSSGISYLHFVHARCEVMKIYEAIPVKASRGHRVVIV
jgi:hypothetical protein